MVFVVEGFGAILTQYITKKKKTWKGVHTILYVLLCFHIQCVLKTFCKGILRNIRNTHVNSILVNYCHQQCDPNIIVVNHQVFINHQWFVKI